MRMCNLMYSAMKSIEIFNGIVSNLNEACGDDNIKFYCRYATDKATPTITLCIRPRGWEAGDITHSVCIFDFLYVEINAKMKNEKAEKALLSLVEALELDRGLAYKILEIFNMFKKQLVGVREPIEVEYLSDLPELEVKI